MAAKPPPNRFGRPVTPDLSDKTHTASGKRKRELVTGKSKKHGGAKWLYERRNGKLIPIRAVGKKGQGANGKPNAPSPSVPKPDSRPFGDYTDEINKGADNEFAGTERQLQQQEGVATSHAADLETVYDKFKGQLMGQAAASQAAQNQAVAQQQSTIANSVGALGQAVGAGAAQQGQLAAQTGGPDYSADVAKIGAAGAAGANAVAQPGATALQGQANADAGFMAQLAGIMDMERGTQTAKAQNNIRDIQGKRSDLSKEKATSKTKRYDELTARDAATKQQEIENTLAEAAITADSEKSRLAYRQKLVELQHDTRTQRERNASALEIAGANNASDESQNNADNATSTANNNADNATSAANSRRAARSRESVAAINQSGKGSVKVKRPDGSTVTLSAADRKKWHDRRRNTINAHTALRNQLAKTGDEGKAIAQVVKDTKLPRNVVGALVNAANHKPATEAQKRALATYFPGGVVPPGYLSGKVN